MAELLIPFDKGYRSAGDPKTYQPGFLTRLANWVYSPDDPDRPHKIPGRTLAGSLPEEATEANSKGLQHLHYDQGTDQLLLLANNQLYEADAGPTLSAWSDVQDNQNTPVTYIRNGSFLKSLGDPLRRHIVWTGESSEAPLVRDSNGNWRTLSLKAPAAPLLTPQVTIGVPARPTAVNTATGIVTSEGTSTASFTSTDFPATLAIDGDPDSYALGGIQVDNAGDGGLLSADFTWAAGSAVARTLHVSFETPLLSLDAFLAPNDVDVIIQINTGAGFVNAYVADASSVRQNFTATLAAIDPANLTVRVMLHHRSGVGLSYLRLRDIYIQPLNTGGPALVTVGGHYHYVITEVYRVQLPEGRSIFVESAPSELGVTAATKGIKGVTIDEEVHYGVTITLPPQANLANEGPTKFPANKEFLFRRIYRSTSTGVWPDLGFVDEVDIETTTYEDTFIKPRGDELGTPGIQVVYVGEAIFPLAGPAPAFYDAANYRGSIVVIPSNNRHALVWSPPGSPDYFPSPHNFSFLTINRSDQGCGIASVGDALLLFLRNAVYRIRNLPSATGGPEFNPISQMQFTELSPSEGLAGSPKGYCKFHSQKGHSLIAWISDSGIWATDGSLVSERGMGLILLTTHLDWPREVDTTRLFEAHLAFDPILQAILLDYYTPDGDRRTLYLHTSAHHWIPSGQDQVVPKLSGIHPMTATARTIGDDGTTLSHWLLDAPGLRVLNERAGTDNVGSQIHSHLQSNWIYPAGARKGFQIYAGSVYHSDWLANEVFDAEIQTRRDVSGITQSSHKKGLSLAGDRITPIPFLRGSGQSLRVALTHSGKTTSSGSPVRAIGPCTIEAELVGEIRKE